MSAHPPICFVLIHGAWHDGALWGPVAGALRAMGHAVHSPTVAGHGAGGDKTVTHEDGVQSIVDFIREQDLRDFVLLGHSFGGTIISRVAEELPERIRRLVYWNAFVLEDGESIADVSPPHYNTMMDGIAAAAGDNTVMLPPPVWREAFMNDADAAFADECYAKLSPEPYRMLTDKVPLKRFATLEIPRSYLNCTEDTAMPHGPFAWHPRFSTRLGLCRLVQMPGGHEVMFTNPEGLAEKIVEAGRD